MAFEHQMTTDGDLLMTEDGDLQGECCCGSADCSDCVASCSGAASVTLVVSGFSVCSLLNGTWVLPLSSGCTWQRFGATVNVITVECATGPSWRISMNVGGTIYAVCYPCVLDCTGDHPTGSGTLQGHAISCSGETGSFTLS